MKNIDRIRESYDFRQTNSGLLAMKKKSTNEVKVVLPSSNTTLYFIFDEEFKKDTVLELVRSRKIIKMTSMEIYKSILSLEEFKKSLDATLKLKFSQDQVV